MQKIISGIVTGLMLLSISTAANGVPVACPDVAAGWDGVYCAGGSDGIVLAGSADRAKQLLEYAAGGKTKFEKLFNQTAARFAIIEISSDLLTEDRHTALRNAGFAVVLPWLSPEAYQKQVEASVRQTVESRLIEAGVPESARPAAVAAALAQAKSQISPDAAAQRDGVAIPHELGHMWLIQAFWPDKTVDSVGHYGGPGPDWLDEMAAVLMEPAESAKRRTELFTERYHAIRVDMRQGRAQTDSLLDLKAYLSTVHPAADAARALVSQSGSDPIGGGMTVRVLTGEEAKRFSGDGIRFYLQSLLVSEYLAARSGDPAVIGKIAAAAANDQSFTDWLSKNNKSTSLPTSLDAMQSDWLDWLEMRFPDPVA